MKENLKYLFQLLKRLGLILMLFSIIKIIFYWVNQSHFPITGNSELITILLQGIRFDITSVIYANSLFILLSLFPIKQRSKTWYQKLMKTCFIFFNSISIGFEIIDIGFYPYAFRRTIGSDLILFKNTSAMIPGFIVEYWYLLLLFVLVVAVLFLFYKITAISVQRGLKPLYQAIIFILAIPTFFVLARGGWQLRPLMPITAFQYVEDSRLVALITNTSLNILFSSQQRFVENPNYYSEKVLKKHIDLTRDYSNSFPMQKRNVMIIVLESFGREHVSYFHPKSGQTPFLDSLIQQSTISEWSFANGLRSTKGIVSITTGIPSLMDMPLMFSPYQNNQISSLAKHLSQKGYRTAFYHGANPGSMEFERFSKAIGFQEYHDRIDFDNDEEYDGQWGIWDEPFFQYTAQQLNQIEQPFMGLLFSLTSHHPYKTPGWFENKFPQLTPQLRSIRYTDYALKQFFDRIQETDWYQNTVFVITADHTGKNKDHFYNTRHGRYAIPIVVFDPQNTVGKIIPGVSQQVDIMPTVLDMLDYDQPFMAFGKSILDSTRQHLSYNYNSGLYHILDKDRLLTFDGQNSLSFYAHHADPFLEHNILETDSIDYRNLENQLKALIQIHHQKLIENSMNSINK